MKNKTAGEVVNEVLMLNSVKKGYAFLVVEGKDDWKFWKTRVHELCEIVDANGKGEGVTAVRRLNARAFPGHVGVFDRDYQDVQRVSSWQANELYWDAHSLETALFYSGGFDTAVTEHADRRRVDALQAEAGRALRDTVEWIAGTVGAIRYVHSLSGSAGDASRLFPTNFVSSDPFRFDEEALLEIGVEIGASPSIVQLRSNIRDYAGLPTRLVIRGHDVSALTAWMIRACGGSCGHERVEQIFRISFAQADLEQTSVYQELRLWEAARGRRVLRT